MQIGDRKSFRSIRKVDAAAGYDSKRDVCGAHHIHGASGKAKLRSRICKGTRSYIQHGLGTAAGQLRYIHIFKFCTAAKSIGFNGGHTIRKGNRGKGRAIGKSAAANGGHAVWNGDRG